MKVGIFTDAKVDIFLDEGMIEDAIALADGLSYYHSALIHRVMGAAISHSPDWVITNACRRAASIMDQGKSNEYNLAIKWLEKPALPIYTLGKIFSGLLIVLN
jgi:Uncharacterized conserved protein